MRVDLSPDAEGECLECKLKKPPRLPAGPVRAVWFVRELPGPREETMAVLWLCDECAAQLAGDLMGALVALAGRKTSDA